MLVRREAVGQIDVFYMDESGFSARSRMPYAWQVCGKTLALPANAPGRVNVIGLMNREGEGYFHRVEGTVTELRSPWQAGLKSGPGRWAAVMHYLDVGGIPTPEAMGLVAVLNDLPVFDALLRHFIVDS